MPVDQRPILIDPGDWTDAVADVEGAQIVVGGPGTGKTEFLVRRVLHLLDDNGVDPKQIAVLSFGRRGAADLERRIRDGLTRSLSGVNVSTFHSLASTIVEWTATRDERPAPRVLTGPEQIGLVRTLLTELGPQPFSAAFKDVTGTLTFAEEVADFVLRCRELLLDRSALAAAASSRAEWRGLDVFLDAYERRLSDLGMVDYGSLLADAVAALGEDRPPPVDHLRYVFVDEYQDTTIAQATLLSALVGTDGHVSVAADPYQSIYSFRGASLDNVAEFHDRFGRPDRPARRLVLTTSFRTPSAVLDAAVRVTTGAELPGSAGPVTPAAGLGRVDVHRFDQEAEESEWIASEILRLHLEHGVPYSAMAVFVRSKRRFLPDLSRALSRRTIPHDSPDSRLADHPAVRFVLDAVVAATLPATSEDARRAVRRLLLGTVYRVPLGVLREVERRHRSTEGTWPEAIAHAAPQLASLASLLADDAWAAGMPAVEGFWHVWSSVPELAAIATSPTRGEERAAWSSLGQVLSRWNERHPDATLDEYRRLTESEDFEARPLLSYRQPDVDRVTLTTLHQSKGLEFDVVFIADAVEGVFPDLRSRDGLLGVRHLLPHVPGDPAAYRAFRLQEERRLAYTAMTRAARRVVWTATSTGFEEGRGVPSRFLALVAGTDTVEAAVTPPPRHDAPVTPREAEAALRRRLQDPAVPAGERLAALSLLVDPADARMRPVEAFAGTLPPGPDHGLVPPSLRLSPSQAEAYAACPRRYALERRIGIGEETTVYATFGTLLHTVLEEAEAAAVAEGRRHATADEAEARLREHFDPGDFGGEPFATAWWRRAVDGLRHLYANWPSKGTPVALERRLDIDLGGVPWLGFADRIEHVDGALTIVDYKTSRSAMPIPKAARSLQLAFYVLAAADDDELAALGRPTAAEMWFPLAKAKSVTTRRLDTDLLDELRGELADAAAGIRAEEWPPNPGDGCDRCRVRLVCPAWPEGAEAFTS